MVGLWSRRIHPDGLVYDYSAGEWYYVDENTGMRTAGIWIRRTADGDYLDPATGEMLTE